MWLLAVGGVLLLVSAALTRHDQVEARRVAQDLAGDWRPEAIASALLTDPWGPDADKPIDLTLTERGRGYLDETREEWHS